MYQRKDSLYVLSLITKIYTLAILIYNGAAADSSLRLVHLVYRHGDRSPLGVYPKDPYPESVWPQGFGQLTELGMRQQYALGAFLRDYYTGFLNHSYVHNEIKIQSSVEARCLMSAETQLSGMYPPSGDQVWNSEIKWQPVPVLTRPILTDNLIAQKRPCPRYFELYTGVLLSEAVRKKEKQNKPFYDFLSNNTGIPVLGVTTISKVGDPLFCQAQHNMTAPSWLTERVNKRLVDIINWKFELMCHLPEMTRLQAGPLLEEITEQMKAKVNGSLDSRMKLFAYSGHDTTLISFLDTLSLWNGLVPPYATTVIVELHATTTATSGKDEAFYVQIKYRNDTTTEPYLLTIPGCDSKCPFNLFLTLTKDMIPDDWEAECQPIDTPLYVSRLPIGVLVAICVASGVIAGFLAFLPVISLRKLCRNRERKATIDEYRPIRVRV